MRKTKDRWREIRVRGRRRVTERRRRSECERQRVGGERLKSAESKGNKEKEKEEWDGGIE